jgi:hypothetical protein
MMHALIEYLLSPLALTYKAFHLLMERALHERD